MGSLVVSALAILPLPGIGGMQLWRAETPGPMKDDKLTPRIANTARALWRIYAVLTVGCALAYWAAGMSLIDAIAHSLATVSTAGFSTHDASLGGYHRQAVELVAVVFMLAGGINFAIHYRAALGADPRVYLAELELRVFLIVVVLAALMVAVTLLGTGYATDVHAALRVALFMVSSVITSTGFGTDDISVWPLHLPLMVILLSFMGGCGGFHGRRHEDHALGDAVPAGAQRGPATDPPPLGGARSSTPGGWCRNACGTRCGVSSPPASRCSCCSCC